MLKLRHLQFDASGNVTDSIDCGSFRSYADIGKRLHSKGKIGSYYVLPSNMTTMAAIREITVTHDKYGIRVDIDGSGYLRIIGAMVGMRNELKGGD